MHNFFLILIKMKKLIYIFLLFISCTQNGANDNTFQNDKGVIVTDKDNLKPLFFSDLLIYWDSSKEVIVKDDNIIKILKSAKEKLGADKFDFKIY